MFEAYSVNEVASKLEKSIDVSCLTAHDRAQKVYIGSKSGHLLSLNGTLEARRSYDLVMCRSFERKSVVALQVVAYYDILLCLADGQVSAHELSEPFSLRATIMDVKPIIAFASKISEEDHLLYVAVSAKRKIFIYKWLHNIFSQIIFNITPENLAESPRYISWCGSVIALAIHNDYHYFVIPRSYESSLAVQVKRLFDIGQKTENPLVIGLNDRKLLAYCRDAFLFFQNYIGQLNCNPEIKLSDSPIQIVYDSPYLVSLLSKGRIEIRSVRPATHIQTIQISKASLISSGLSGTIYVASSSVVWKMDSKSLMKANVDRLVAEKHYELAIQIAVRCSDIDDNGITAIKRKAAFSLFSQRKFDEWLEVHENIKTDVMTVIAHFPHLLDNSFRDSLKSLLDDPQPDFTENDYKNGYLALAPYLAAVRMEHAKAVTSIKNSSIKTSAMINDLIDHQNVLQVVDTILLKCYLATNQSLIAPLLRLPDNMCILSDAESALIENEKYFELYLLYERRSMHYKALELLKNQSRIANTRLCGHKMTLEYLKKLDNSNLDLIFTFSSWILQTNFEDGLSIFTYDVDDTRSLDRERVLQFLTSECVAAMMPYLEHIIFAWNERRPKFHNALGELYIAKVKTLIREYISTLKDGDDMAPVGKEEGELGEYRRKLDHFLRSSVFYTPEKLLVLLRLDSLFEERAILLGRLKRHEQALAIYTNLLNDYRAAEDYCKLYYNPLDPDNSKIYMIALKMYLHPPDSSLLGLMERSLHSMQPNHSEAVRLLKNHADSLNLVEAISLLPPDFQLKSIWVALEAVLQAVRDKHTSILIHKSLCDAAFIACSLRLKNARRAKIVIGYDVHCAICSKRISSSAFSRHPNGRLEHLHCYQSQSD